MAKRMSGGQCQADCDYCGAIQCSLPFGHYCSVSPHDCGNHDREERERIARRWHG